MVLLLSSCAKTQGTAHMTAAIPSSTIAATSPATKERETLNAVPTMTSLPQPCATPAPDELNDFIKRSITIEDNGKTFTTHVTSRFWIYLDDRIYPLPDLLNAIPKGLIGYVSNGSVRGPQCYPVMFEAVQEGKELLRIKDFQIWINVNNRASESPLPLP